MRYFPAFCLLLLATAIGVGSAHAGGNTIRFGNSAAEECYQGANLAHLYADLAMPACNEALISARITRRERASTLVNRGILETHQRRFDAALADFDRALKLIPGFAEAYLNRGNAMLFTGRFDRAVADYDAAIEGGTRKLHAAYYNRGLAREALMQPRLAYQDFRRAAEIRPTWSLATHRVERYAGKGFGQ